MSHLDFWNSVKETDTKYTKQYEEGGKTLTAINPMYTIQKATEKFGMYGKGWGVNLLTYSIIKGADGTPLVVALDAEFWWREDEVIYAFPISSEMDFWNGKTINQNVRKSLLTDVTTKALSKLGFNADVYMGQFDDVGYVDGQKLKHELNTIVFNNQALKKYADTIRTHMASGETPNQIKENILKKYRSIDKKTEAILRTLTLDNLDDNINLIQ
jgi:hypothetical protein